MSTGFASTVRNISFLDKGGRLEREDEERRTF
jgi:hypothetical protein